MTIPQLKPAVWAILAVALALRVGAALYLGPEVQGLSGAFDEVTYSELGHRFATGHGLTFAENWYPWIQADAPQSYFSFAMSGSLGLLYWLFGYQPLTARLLMALMSTGVVAMTYVVGRRFFSERAATLAALVAAVHAYLIFYGAALVTETPFTFFLLTAIYAADRLRSEPTPRLWVALGAAVVCAVHLRMAVVFFVPFLLWWAMGAQPARRRTWAVVPVVALMVSVLPFTLWNYKTWGYPLVLQSQFGHVFWNGNHPGHRGDFHPYRVFDIPPEVLALDNDALITNRLLELGVKRVQEDPGDFARLSLTRLRELFVFWPTANSSTDANALRVLSVGILAPFTLAGVLMGAPNWRRLAPIYLFLATHVGIHAATWAMVRYRVPLDPFFALFASSAMLALKDRVVNPRARVDPKTALASTMHT